MRNYRKPNFAREVTVLIISVPILLFLWKYNPSNGLVIFLGLVGAVIAGMLAVQSSMTLLCFHKLERRYHTRKRRRYVPDVITDEILDVLDHLDLKHYNSRGFRTERFTLAVDNLKLDIVKYRRLYLCVFSSEEFGSYNIDTSTETRIRKEQRFVIPRHLQNGIIQVEELERSVIGGVYKRDVDPSALLDLLKHLAHGRRNAREADQSELFRLNSHLRYVAQA